MTTTYIFDGEKIVRKTNDFQEACRYYIENRPHNENLRLMDSIPDEVIVAAYIANSRKATRVPGR